jgi:acyl-CoA-dependent ceramide synthase
LVFGQQVFDLWPRCDELTLLTTGLSLNLLALLFLVHGCMPRAREHTIKFFTLSHYNPKSGKYGLGWDDGHLILACIILFTGLRAAAMEYLLAPFAKAQGIAKRKDLTRFSEQAWLLIYCSVFWTLGMVCAASTRSAGGAVERRRC